MFAQWCPWSWYRGWHVWRYFPPPEKQQIWWLRYSWRTHHPLIWCAISTSFRDFTAGTTSPGASGYQSRTNGLFSNWYSPPSVLWDVPINGLSDLLPCSFIFEFCQGPDVATSLARWPQVRRGPEPLRQWLGKGTLLVQKLKYLVENRVGRKKREWLPTLQWTDIEFIHVASGGWKRRIQIFPEQ